MLGAPHKCALWITLLVPRRVLRMLHGVKDTMPERKGGQIGRVVRCRLIRTYLETQC